MMDTAALYEILAETTTAFRNGSAIHEEGGAFYFMPHVSQAAPELDLVDVHFLTVGVDKEKAAARRDAFIDILAHWPDRASLAAGPSYIAVGADIGDQQAALQMFALGHSLGLWQIITPKSLYLHGMEAEAAAGRGYIMISGWREQNGSAHSRTE